MFTFRKTALAAVLIGATAGAAFADSHGNPAVKARKQVMGLYAFHLGTLGAMAQGKMDYDAELATKAASNLAALTSLDQSMMWPAGTDSGSMEGTRAKADIWSNFPDVAAKGAALADASMAMKEAAGGGLESLQAAMGPLGGSCGGCHKPYREPES